MAMLRSFPSDGRGNEGRFLLRIEQALAFKLDLAVPRDDGKGAFAVLVQARIGSLGNFGKPTVGGFKDLPGELSFEFLTGLLDSRLDLIQFMVIKRRGKLNLKRSGDGIMVFLTCDFTIQRHCGILFLGEHGDPP